MLTRSTSTPGTLRIIENGSREVGIFDSSSAVKFVAVPVTGVDDRRRPLTVIDPVTVATLIITGRSMVAPTATITFSRTVVLKPGNAVATL